jgi:hypothetical protein
MVDEEFVEGFRFIGEKNGTFRGTFLYVREIPGIRARISIERSTRRLVVRSSRLGRFEVVWKTKKGLI